MFMPQSKLLVSSSLVLEYLNIYVPLNLVSFCDVCGANENQTEV